MFVTITECDGGGGNRYSRVCFSQRVTDTWADLLPWSDAVSLAALVHVVFVRIVRDQSRF